jgi:ribosome-associated protein
VEQAIEISGDMIQHGQLLKLAGTATGGADAKALIANGHVTVNGEPELRRGRELHQGDIVGIGSDDLRIVPARPFRRHGIISCSGYMGATTRKHQGLARSDRGQSASGPERAGAGHTGCASALKCGQIWAPRDAMSRQTRREHRVGRTRRSAASWARLLTAK